MTTELHFSPRAQDVDTVLADITRLSTAAEHEHRVSYYYDTAERTLQQAGYGLATCWARGRWTQTLRAADQPQPLVSESESDEIDYTHLPVQGKLGRQLADIIIKQNLERLFRVELQRSRWEAQLSEETQIAVILDRGEIKTAGRREPLCELSIELTTGSARDVYQWARNLAERYALPWASSDVMTRGHALASASPLTHHKAQPLVLGDECRAEEAFIAIGKACLDHAQCNRDAVCARQEEGVHQMRVAFRRFRSCLKTFRSVIPREASQPLVEELRWLNGFLGPARDWDVFFAESLQPILNRFPDKRGLQILRRRVEEKRAAHYQALQKCLEDPRYHRLILRGHSWLDCRAWRDGLNTEQLETLEQPAVKFAVALLKRQHRKVTQWGVQFATLSAVERHQLRIRIKELRYAAEFFASLFPGTLALDYAKTAGKLQDCLGALNDLSVSEHLLDDLQVRPKSPVRTVIESWYACKADYQEQAFGPLWEIFLNWKRPWKA
ncbi:MAG: CHAD domain-containing protein [Gammaproteobacteria bacterium]|nr:CHAD domain-containing protein [Gammaproteobacteria bacterium]MCP5426608.1 CHAD domain-containing protein [Gammaproteobacteria bacterium]MCP5459149.1 CHAD domain-containing protein [Gammaproteobacteria bacterium]